MTSRFILTLTLLGVGTLFDAASAHAIPAFARRYQVSCQMCHDPAPRLNAFGEAFAANGFEFTPAEPPRDTIEVGDPLLRLIRRLDLAVRFDGYLAYARPTGRDGRGLDLQTPYNIKVLSGGPIADRISYYMYFFLSERGEVAGLEDAYLQFTDVAGSGVSVIAGQFQVSDPLFKRELRLPVEDYQPYRVRVGNVRADLTYERGLLATYDPWAGGALAVMLVNGQGLREAGEDRMYDRDALKNVALHLSQELHPRLRLGVFGYWGREAAEGERDRIVVWGPDATLVPREKVEINLQFLRREDSNPLLTPAGTSSRVNSVLGEVVAGPWGDQGRWYATALYNWIEADRPLVSLRLGEQQTPTGYLDRYQTVSGGLHYLLERNIRVVGEAGWDLERQEPRVTVGATLAW